MVAPSRGSFSFVFYSTPGIRIIFGENRTGKLSGGIYIYIFFFQRRLISFIMFVNILFIYVHTYIRVIFISFAECPEFKRIF